MAKKTSHKRSSRTAGPQNTKKTVRARVAPKKTTTSKRGASKQTLPDLSHPAPKRKQRITASAASRGYKISRKFGGIVPPELTYKTRGPRLQKVMADAGIASRRDCELLIAKGHVSVNGELVTGTPVFVDPKIDKIEVQGTLLNNNPNKKPTTKTITKSTKTITKAYILVNKPKNVICTTSDPSGRKKITDLITDLPKGFPTRLYPIGRLDADSTGLIILTNDGDLTNALTHPSYGVPKKYRVQLRGIITDQDIQKLKDGLYLADQKSALKRHQKGITAKKASMLNIKKIGYTKDKTYGDQSSVEITLNEGQNREIRRMLSRLGYKVKKLERIAIGPITVKGIPLGQWKLLTNAQVARLFKTAGFKPTTAPNDKPTSIKKSKEQIQMEIEERDKQHKK